VTEVQGGVPQGFMIGKLTPPGATVREVKVGGAPGIWLEGTPHQVYYLGRDGSVRNATTHLATNTLLWERSGILYRLEYNVSLDAAQQVAGTFGS